MMRTRPLILGLAAALAAALVGCAPVAGMVAGPSLAVGTTAATGKTSRRSPGFARDRQGLFDPPQPAGADLLPRRRADLADRMSSATAPSATSPVTTAAIPTKAASAPSSMRARVPPSRRLQTSPLSPIPSNMNCTASAARRMPTTRLMTFCPVTPRTACRRPAISSSTSVSAITRVRAAITAA